MDFLQELNKLMNETASIALATSVDNIPNVRMLNFYYDAEKKGVVYFYSFKGSPKTAEFAQNNKVSFTTIPAGPQGHVRVFNGTINESTLKLPELLEMYAKKYPGINKDFPNGDMMRVYEIHFNEAEVVLGIDKRSRVTL